MGHAASRLALLIATLCTAACAPAADRSPDSTGVAAASDSPAELIPLEDLFDNPVMHSGGISPDGRCNREPQNRLETSLSYTQWRI